MSPFTYPAAPHVRRHGPQGYADYASYRPWLRDEFGFRCVYCSLREQWGRTAGMFDLDHFLPTAHFPGEHGGYDNLLYCCARCNTAKADAVIPDPCQVLVSGEVEVHPDGTLETHTPEARRLVRKLTLDDQKATEFRMLWIRIIAMAQLTTRHCTADSWAFPTISRTSRASARRACWSAVSSNANWGRRAETY
jgi:hypothetical protein